MQNDHNQDEHKSMTRESHERKPESDEPRSETDTAPSSKRGRRKDLTPEKQGELQARQRAIGQELRRMFDDVAREPVPDELLDLLQQIDKKRED
jgi:Anti-sigma factor NepR